VTERKRLYQPVSARAADTIACTADIIACTADIIARTADIIARRGEGSGASKVLSTRGQATGPHLPTHRSCPPRRLFQASIRPVET
jgi:hypothetical protein